MNPTKHLDTLTTLWAERQEMDEREYQAVKAARRAGATWQQIGDNMGTSRQSAHERFTRLGVR